VFARHALHKIVGIVYYRDGYNNEMLAVKIARPEANVYDVYIYQCEDEVRLHNFWRENDVICAPLCS